MSLQMVEKQPESVLIFKKWQVAIYQKKETLQTLLYQKTH